MEVTLQYKDESKVWIHADASVKAELSDKLTFMVPGYQYMPKFRSGWWDGKIRMFNQHSDSLHCGLIPEAAKMCQAYGYRLNAGPDVTGLFLNFSYSEDSLDEWLDGLYITDAKGERIFLHDHQREAIHTCLKQKRVTLLSPTSSGKSLMIYCISRYLTEMQDMWGKVLIVVPTTGLVEQLHDNFMEYSSSDPSLPSDFRVHRIYAGKDKIDSARIFVSTWQSLVKLKPEWFADFQAIMIDECHNAKGPSLQGILEKSDKAEFRFGFTGTLDGTQIHALVVKSALGPIKKTVTTKELMDSGVVAQLEIHNVILDHCEVDRIMVSKMDYDAEMAFIEAHRGRTEFIALMCSKLKGNKLVLFRKKAHGKFLFEQFSKIPGKKVYLLSGDNPVAERTMVKKILESEEDVDLIASYGIFSTGESVKNIRHVVFGSTMKSRIKVLQSIGRGLRVMAGKTSVKLWDIVDDFSTKTKQGAEKKVNTSLKHFRERVKIYDSEQFDYQTITINIRDHDGESLADRAN